MRRSLVRTYGPAPQGAFRVSGEQGANSQAFTGANGEQVARKTNAGGFPGTGLIEYGFTPEVACWWPVFGTMALLCQTAAWGDIYVRVKLSTGADAINGQLGFDVSDQSHNALPGYKSLSPSGIYALAAGTAYNVQLKVVASTGGIGWVYYHSPELLNLWSPGIIPR